MPKYECRRLGAQVGGNDDAVTLVEINEDGDEDEIAVLATMTLAERLQTVLEDSEHIFSVRAKLLARRAASGYKSPEEATRDQEIIAQVEQELPELVQRHDGRELCRVCNRPLSDHVDEGNWCPQRGYLSSFIGSGRYATAFERMERDPYTRSFAEVAARRAEESAVPRLAQLLRDEFSEPDPVALVNIQSDAEWVPDFQYDWRTYVPANVQGLWPKLDLQSRLLACYLAHKAVDATSQFDDGD